MFVHFTVETSLMPKPRGKLGKHGNIYHNDTKYLSYKKQIDAQLKSQIPKKYPWNYPLGLFVVNEFLVGRGSEPDLVDNQIGSLLDILVQKNYIIDDSRKFVRRSYVEGIESYRDRSVVWIFESQHRDELYDLFWKEVQEVNVYLAIKNFESKYGF